MGAPAARSLERRGSAEKDSEDIVVFGGRQQGLQLPLPLEFLVQKTQSLYQPVARVFQRRSWVVAFLRLEPHHEVGKERVLDLVCGEQHLWVVDELVSEQVSQRVVFSLKLY